MKLIWISSSKRKVSWILLFLIHLFLKSERICYHKSIETEFQNLLIKWQTIQMLLTMIIIKHGTKSLILLINMISLCNKRAPSIHFWEREEAIKSKVWEQVPRHSSRDQYKLRIHMIDHCCSKEMGQLSLILFHSNSKLKTHKRDSSKKWKVKLE